VSDAFGCQEWGSTFFSYSVLIYRVSELVMRTGSLAMGRTCDLERRLILTGNDAHLMYTAPNQFSGKGGYL
jgi:hypothetical protein